MLDFSRSNLPSDLHLGLEPHVALSIQQAAEHDLNLSSFNGVEVVSDIGARMWELSRSKHDDDKDSHTWAYVHTFDDCTSRVILSDYGARELLAGVPHAAAKLLHELVHVHQAHYLVPLFGHHNPHASLETVTAAVYWKEYHANKIGNSILSHDAAHGEFMEFLRGCLVDMGTMECMPLSPSEQAKKHESFPIEKISRRIIYAFGTLDSREPQARETWEGVMWKRVHKRSPDWLEYLQTTLTLLRATTSFSATMFHPLESHFKKWLYPS